MKESGEFSHILSSYFPIDPTFSTSLAEISPRRLLRRTLGRDDSISAFCPGPKS